MTLRTTPTLFRLASLVCITCLPAWSQTAESRALGVVVTLDAEARQMTLKTDQGEQVQISLDARASFRRVAPGETSLANASPIALGDVHVGDRVLARGRKAAGTDSLNALQVIVMSQADIANKQAQDRADWDRRGATGTVTEATADHVTITIRTLGSTQTMTITPAPTAVIRRYAPDSVKFEQARPSQLSEIRVGDQVRARGDKAADNSKMTAEEIVSGAFRTIAGVIVSTAPGENLIRINNLQTRKPMTVKLSPDSSLKKLDANAAMMLAMRLRGGGRGGPGAAGPPNTEAPGAAARGGEGRGTFVSPGGPSGEGRGEGRGFAGRGFGGRGGPGGDLQALIDRTPTIALGDLKSGDAIVVSSTVGASADQVTAITLIAGVEPILARPGSGEMSLGDWNMGGDLGGGLGGFGQ